MQGMALQTVALQVLHAVLELPPRQRVHFHWRPLLKHLSAQHRRSMSAERSSHGAILQRSNVRLGENQVWRRA